MYLLEKIGVFRVVFTKTVGGVTRQVKVNVLATTVIEAINKAEDCVERDWKFASISKGPLYVSTAECAASIAEQESGPIRNKTLKFSTEELTNEDKKKDS